MHYKEADLKEFFKRMSSSGEKSPKFFLEFLNSSTGEFHSRIRVSSILESGTVFYTYVDEGRIKTHEWNISYEDFSVIGLIPPNRLNPSRAADMPVVQVRSV